MAATLWKEYKTVKVEKRMASAGAFSIVLRNAMR